MKKILAVLMCVMLSLVMMSCSSSNEKTVKETAATSKTSEEKENTVIVEKNVASEEKPSAVIIEDDEEEVFVSSGSNTLVVYFSMTGNTKKLAEYAADYCGADLLKIRAKTSYTSEDIDYNNPDSRVSVEQKDSSARPEISNLIPSIEQYNTVIIAYPIWCGKAPRIISTFLESYDFSNKTIIPFCTSASSDIGNSDKELHSLTSDSTIWVQGKRFAADTSEEVIVAWLESYFF